MPQASLVFVSWPAPEIRSTPSRSLSPGPVSPETDLCGESSRHHMLVLCPYELYLLEQLGLWHHVWRTQQNKDLTTTRCSTVLPDHPLCFVLDLPQIAVLPVEGGEMTVCLSAKEPKLHHVLIWAASSCHGADWPTGLFFLFFYLFCKRYVLSPNYLWVIINGSPYNWQRSVTTNR